MGGKSYTEIVQSDEVQKMVGGYVDELNSHLNRWETIKKWKLLDHDLTVESGELTPSMKVKRNVVAGQQPGAHRPDVRLGLTDGRVPVGDRRHPFARPARGWIPACPPPSPTATPPPRTACSPTRRGPSSAASPSASTSTCRSARCGAATATSTPTPPRSSATRCGASRSSYAEAAIRRDPLRAPGARPPRRPDRDDLLRRWHPDAPQGRRPRGHRGQRRGGVRPRRRRRDHDRGQPRQRRRLGPRGAAHGRLQPDQLRHAVRGRPRAAHARPHPRPDARARGRRLGPAGRLRRRQPRPHLRHAGGVAGRLGDLGRRRARLRARPRLGLLAHRRGRHRAGAARSRAASCRCPTRTTWPTSTTSPTRSSPPPG